MENPSAPTGWLSRNPTPLALDAGADWGDDARYRENTGHKLKTSILPETVPARCRWLLLIMAHRRRD